MSEEQRERTGAIFEEMQRDAIRVGKEIIEHERALDAAFASGDRGALEQAESLVLSIGRLRGELRWIHLRAHVLMQRVLTSSQVEAYERSRGYVDVPEG